MNGGTSSDVFQCNVLRLVHTFGNSSDSKTMEIRQVRYFMEVAAGGSFNQAAARLHLTQPAVSRQIKALEEDLGVVLLARGKRSVALTQEGEIFYEEAQDLLAHIDRVVRRVQSNQSREVLRVGYAPSLASDLLPKAIAHFKVLQRNEILAFRRLQSEFALRVLAIRRQRRVWFRNFDHH